MHCLLPSVATNRSRCLLSLLLSALMPLVDLMGLQVVTIIAACLFRTFMVGTTATFLSLCFPRVLSPRFVHKIAANLTFGHCQCRILPVDITSSDLVAVSSRTAPSPNIRRLRRVTLITRIQMNFLSQTWSAVRRHVISERPGDRMVHYLSYRPTQLLSVKSLNRTNTLLPNHVSRATRKVQGSGGCEF